MFIVVYKRLLKRWLVLPKISQRRTVGLDVFSRTLLKWFINKKYRNWNVKWLTIHYMMTLDLIIWPQHRVHICYVKNISFSLNEICGQLFFSIKVMMTYNFFPAVISLPLGRVFKIINNHTPTFFRVGQTYGDTYFKKVFLSNVLNN